MFRRRDFEDDDGETLVDTRPAIQGYVPDLVGGDDAADDTDGGTPLISPASASNAAVSEPLDAVRENADGETDSADADALAAGSAVTPPAQKKFTLADHIANQRAQSSAPKAKTEPAPSFSTRKSETSRMFEDPKTESSPSNDFSSAADRSSKRTLVVGLETFLKGEISNCDRVVIEGGVDANMGDVQSLVIASTGTFHGSATLENAEISGVFEGDLTVRGRLLINSTGRVTGKITYGDIEVKRGGKILGEISSVDDKVDNNAASEAASVALV